MRCRAAAGSGQLGVARDAGERPAVLAQREQRALDVVDRLRRGGVGEPGRRAPARRPGSADRARRRPRCRRPRPARCRRACRCPGPTLPRNATPDPARRRGRARRARWRPRPPASRVDRDVETLFGLGLLRPRQWRTGARAAPGTGGRRRAGAPLRGPTAARARASSVDVDVDVAHQFGEPAVAARRWRGARAARRRPCPSPCRRCSISARSEPYSRTHFAAVFSPTPGMPGRLSLGSPRSAAKSGYCAGLRPYFASHLLGREPGHLAHAAPRVQHGDVVVDQLAARRGRRCRSARRCPAAVACVVTVAMTSSAS